VLIAPSIINVYEIGSQTARVHVTKEYNLEELAFLKSKRSIGRLLFFNFLGNHNPR